MQFIKLTIEGEYWDSFLYSAFLHLIEADSSFFALPWQDIINWFNVDPNLDFAMQCAFVHGDWLYGPKYRRLFSDQEFRDLLRSKFDRLATQELFLDLSTIRGYRRNRTNIRHPFPFTDMSFYRQHFYTSSLEGIHYNRLVSGSQIPKHIPSLRLWDCPSTTIVASHFNLATATGPDGLYKVSLYDDDGEHRNSDVFDQLSSEDTIHCNWLDYGIYGSSHQERSCFADFEPEPSRDSARSSNKKQNAMFESVLPDVAEGKPSTDTKNKLIYKGNTYVEGISHDRGYSWGSHDKLYLTSNNKIKVVKVQTRGPKRNLQFFQPTDRDLRLPFGSVVSGAVAPFGTIIECDNGITLLRSDGETIDFPGEPVRYRVFNQSSYYQNQLHILYEDRLEIYSFYSDYFVDQHQKTFGYTAFA